MEETCRDCSRAGRAPTDVISVHGEEDKWRGYGTKVVLRPRPSFLNCGKKNASSDKGKVNNHI